MIMKNFNLKKKGAVEMSLNLIIMLVIGLTVMGLIIAFVTNFLNEAVGGIGDTLSDAEEQRLREIQNEQGNFVVQPSQFTLSRGGSRTIFMKMENPTSEAVEGIFAGGVLGTTPGRFFYNITGSNAANANFRVELNPLRLDASQTNSFRMIVSVGGGTPSGNYFLTFNWQDPTFARNYTQSITVVVE
ncbi:MAG: hypothetical protein LAT82_01315 [Nanoarchaeota archaeon]|nr:hypothetical protein [Nanoarchaeota archaeon]